MPCHNSKNFEQIHWNQLFCRMYGLAVMLSISTRTTSKTINKIWNKSGHANLRVGSPNTVYPSYCIISANKKDWEHLTQAMTTATRLWGYAKNSLLSTYSSPNVLSAYIICFVATESTQCNILHLKISIWLNGYT